MKPFKSKTENEIRKTLEKAMRSHSSTVSRLTTNIIEITDNFQTRFINCKTLKIFEVPGDVRCYKNSKIVRMSGKTNIEMARELIKSLCD